MDIAERGTVELQVPTTYDGFISYSHAADDLLAPRLQAGLQRFAKPWWKRRAVRIFRDESSLAANPHLWSSIAEALDDSGWFVLLLSPDAASSEWVGKEIEHWVANKDSGRILPVVTDGEFTWNDGDVAGSSVPPALHGVFDGEPRWVDLRFARGDENLDLKNPEFSSALADVASAIRGVPKDELASEEVRQHRRTVRTAWAAGIAVTVLAIAAIVAGVFAIGQRNDARENADTAKTEAERANQEAERANDEAGRADLNAQLATAREFAASAVAALDKDPELATLLALHSIDSSPTDEDPPLEVLNALWRAGDANRLVDEWDYGGFWHSDLSPDATRFAYFDGPRELVLMDATNGEPIWTYVEEDTVDFFDFPAIGPDGRVALLIVDSTSFLNPFQTEEADDLFARVVILHADTGEALHTIPYDECSTIWHPEWSPDGRFLVVSSGGGCDRGSGNTWIDVFETATWARVATLDVPEATVALRPRFDDTGALHVTSFQGVIYTFEAETFEPRSRSGATGFGDVYPTGDRYLLGHSTTATGGTAFSAWIVDAASGDTMDVLYNGTDAPRMPAVTVTRDGRLGVVGTDARYSFVYDLATNRLLHRLPTGPLISSSYNPETQLLYTTGDEPGVKIWDMSEAPVGVDISGDLRGFTFADDDFRTLNSFVVGPELVGMVTTSDPNSESIASQFVDRSTGELVGEPVEGLAVEHGLPNGKFVLTDLGAVLVGNSATQGRLSTTGVIWDPSTGESVVLFDCERETDPSTGNRFCAEASGPPNYRVLISPNGDKVLAYGFELQGALPQFTGHFRAFDAETGDLVASSGPDEEPSAQDPYRSSERFGGRSVSGESWIFGGFNDSGVAYDLRTGEVLYRLDRIVSDIEVSPDRGSVASVRNFLSVVVTDTDTWEEVASITTETRVLSVAFNSDGSKLAIADLASLRVVDVATGSVVQQMGLPNVADVHWLDDLNIVVGTTSGGIGTISLSTEEFLSETRDRLRRSFTSQECETYRIDPCPTLDEIRSR